MTVAIPMTDRRSSRVSRGDDASPGGRGRGRDVTRSPDATLDATGSHLQQPGRSDRGTRARHLVVARRRAPGRSARRWPSMTRSVSRRRALPAGIPAYSSYPIGAPKRTVTLASRGNRAPDRLDVLRAGQGPTGTTGTFAVSARHPTPSGRGRAGRPATGCPPDRCRTPRPPSTSSAASRLLLRGRRRVPVDRHHPDGPEEALAHEAADARPRAVLLLGEEADLPWRASGIAKESMNDRWLLATMTPPSRGCSPCPRSSAGTARG